MALLKGLLWPFERFNNVVLALGRWIAMIAIALMVGAILIQVFFRYVLNSPLPWPDEAARFFMLWMTGLIAPLAYRRGGFVAIDMLQRAPPFRVGAVLSVFLLIITGVVLGFAIEIGWGEVTGFISKAKTASLYYLNTDLEWVKVPRRWMMYSFFVGVILLFIVNCELFLRALIAALGGGDDLTPLTAPEDEIMAE